MKKSILSFVAVLAVIALLSCTAAFGLNVGPLSIASVMDEEDGIRRGLDLVGGSSPGGISGAVAELHQQYCRGFCPG